MQKFFRSLSWFFLFLMILVLVFGNLFYTFWQPLVRNYLSTVIPAGEEISLPTLHRYTLDLQVDKAIFSRYEPIKFALVVRHRKTSEVVTNTLVRLRVEDSQGNILRDIREYDEVWIQYDPAQKVWHGLWYPSTDFKGEVIRLVFTAQFSDPVEPLVVTRDIAMRQGQLIRSVGSGLSFFYLEEMESISRRSLLDRYNEEKDWNTLPQWLTFLNVDGVLIMGGVTRFLEDYSFQDPWNKQKLQEALTVSRWTVGQGKRAGIWVKAFRGDGNLVSGSGYEASWYQKDNQWLQDVSVISFTADSRYKSLASLLNTLQEQDTISYIGLSDYLLSDVYGMELAVPFVEAVTPKLLSDWTNRTWEQKFAYARSYLESKQNFAVFLQWKRYYLVSKLREILQSVRKPVFYVLNWEDLESQPDMLETLDSVGIDFFVIQLKMSYRDFIDNGQRLLIDSRIKPYISRIIWVNQIQYQNFYLSPSMPQSIDGFVAFNEEIVKNSLGSQPSLGLGINFYKAMYGNRGPYNPIEWLMGAGESFTRIRQIHTRLPLDVDLLVPRLIGTNTFQVRIRLQNTSLFPIEKLTVEHIPTRMVSINGTPKLIWNTLAPGERDDALMSFSLDVASDKFVRKDLLVAFRISWSLAGKEDSLIIVRSSLQATSGQTNQ